MKIVLLALCDNSAYACDWLQQRYPNVDIERIHRDQLEISNLRQCLRALRLMQPDVFVVVTESVAWQQGQNAFLLFGALGGAHRVLLLDAHGGRREETRSRVLLCAPFRLTKEVGASWKTVRRARRELGRLECAVEQYSRTNQAGADTQVNTAVGPLRITYLRTTPAAGTQSGGAATHTNGFINAAAQLGARVSVISNDHIAGLVEDRVSLKLIEPDPLGLTRSVFDLRNGLLFTKRACAEIAKQPPDFIYQRYSRLNWTGVEASLRARRPLFLEYNGSEVWMAKHWGRLRLSDLLERCERLNLTTAARVFVVAEVERDNLIKAGIAPDRIVVNSNGVDVEKFRPGVGGEALRGELGVSRDETLAGFVGTFGPWHGVRTLAEAITLLPNDCGLRFLLVGAGRLREKVERIVRNAGRCSQVIFTGQVDHERVPALLDACDILLSPHVPLEDGSEFFGSPTKLFEYMAMGKGIVASRLGQIGEVLRDNETALLVEPGSAQELSEAILRLSQSRELRERLGTAARRDAVERHTWKRNAARVFDAYRNWMKA